jgi:hypothetical protein
LLTKLGSAGQLLFGPDKCLIRLTTRVHGHAILCGHPKDGCRRLKHKQLQGTPDRIGVVGIYNATPNATGAVLGAIEDTLVTEEKMERQHQENRRRLEALGGSAQKRTTEDTIRDGPPTQVHFDTNPELLNKPPSSTTNRLDNEPPSGTPAQPQRNQIQEWISGLTPPEPVSAHYIGHEPLPPPPLAPTHPDPSSAGYAVPALLRTLIDEFKGLREGLEVQQRALAAEASKYEARTTVVAPDGAPPANTAGRGSTPVTTVVVEDDDSTVIQPLFEKPRKLKKNNHVVYGVARGRRTGIF